ncbi:hypothetical protein QTP88_023362 [Uroleucon formosanum]
MISLEAISITISTNKHQIKIISAYNPPNKKIQKKDISKIFDNHPTILLGDLNPKNQIWGCLKTNPNGIKRLQISSELRILISPSSKPTFQRSGRVPDILDIALISNLPTTLHHQVINELDSDHVPVITTLNEPLIMNQCTPKLITVPINWQTFREKLNTNLSCTRQYKNPEDINTIRIGTQLSQPQKIQAGVPQGSVLGPTLFNIYCHDIPTPPNSQLAMFADDTTIITQNNSIQSSIQNLQTALNTVTSWFKTWKLNLNPTKSAAKIFSLKRYKDPQLVYIDNQPIQWNKKDDSVKYLGVFLDEKLTWKIHINKYSPKAMQE